MKKAVSLILALTLCVALAVPAFAADYGKITLSGYEGSGGNEATITFDAAVQETKTLKTKALYQSDFQTDDVIVITVKPDSNVSFYINLGEADGLTSYLATAYAFNAAANGYEEIDIGNLNFVSLDSGKVDDLFTNEAFSGTASMVAVNLGVAVYYIVLGDASSTAPATTTEKPAATETPATTTPATTAPAATPAGSGSCTAQKYDTYGKLAVNYYGSYAYTAALQKANGYKALKAGAAVTLPDKLGNAARLAPAVAGAGEKLYTVVAGDTLGTIAKAYYGNSAQYKAIFERNADRLKNANTIYEGQIIVLPAK